MLNTRQDLALGSAIGAKFVCHDGSRHIAQALQQLAKEALGRLRVAAALDQHIEHVAVLINGPPEVVQFASDADENLVQKSLVTGFRPPLEGRSVAPSEAQAPLTDGLVADHNAPSCQDQLDFT